jgi:peroxiredoxin
VALSADRPEKLRETIDRHQLTWRLFSDARSTAALAFRVDDATVEQYKRYSIDLEAASGETHHVLPVPGVFLIDAAGKVQFSYVHPDYRVRIPAAAVLAAAKSISK